MHTNKFSLLELYDNTDEIQSNQKNNSSKSINYRYNTTKDYTKILRKDSNKNVKKLLCQNIVNFGTCDYGDKCHYAHKLSEQKMDENRQFVYDILDNDEDLSYIDLKKDTSIYKNFQDLTRVCEDCLLGKCTGGYNCRFGACLSKYQICSKDLNYGNCDGECQLIHLTKRGLKYYHYYQKPVIPDQYFSYRNAALNKIGHDSDKYINNGVLLSDDFLKFLLPKNDNNDNNNDNSDIGSDDLDIISKDLSDINIDDNIFESIFS